MSKINAKLARSRKNFCDTIDRQIAALVNPGFTYLHGGVVHRPHRWVSHTYQNDNAVIGLRYGARFLKRNGKPVSITVPKATPERVVTALERVKRKINKGSFDTDLVKVRLKYWA